jgi:TRAP-type C4-dicarboxylate transport system permease small subunit
MEKARQLVDRLLYVLSGLMLALIVFSVAIELFFRFILQSSLPWSGELGTMGLVWMSFLAGSYAISKKANIRIDLLASYLPARFKAWLEFVTNGLLLLLFAVLCVIGLKYMLAIAPARTGALVVSQAYFYAAVPVSAVFMFFYTFAALWDERPWRPAASEAGKGAAE